MLWRLFRGLFIDPFVYLAIELLKMIVGFAFLAFLAALVAIATYIGLSLYGWDHGPSKGYSVIIGVIGGCVWACAIGGNPKYRNIRGRSSSWMTKGSWWSS